MQRWPIVEIHGPNAAAAVVELQDLLEAELGERARQVEPRSAVEVATMRGADPVAITALVLAIPSAITGTMDLAQRLKLKQKIDRLLDWARSRRAVDPGSELVLVTSDGRSLPLDRTDAGQVLDTLAEASSPTVGSPR